MKLVWSAFAAVGAGLVATGLFVVTKPHVFERVESPSGRTVAVLFSLGEDEPLPYGNGLVLASSWNPAPERFSDPVFLGDCSGPEVLRWQSEKRLLVRCAYRERVDLMERRWRDVAISYEFEKQLPDAPHN